MKTRRIIRRVTLLIVPPLLLLSRHASSSGYAKPDIVNAKKVASQFYRARFDSISCFESAPVALLRISKQNTKTN